MSVIEFLVGTHEDLCVLVYLGFYKYLMKPYGHNLVVYLVPCLFIMNNQKSYILKVTGIEYNILLSESISSTNFVVHAMGIWHFIL